MTRINPFRSTPFHNTPSISDSIAWGKINLGTTASPLVFAAILIVCSLAVGCSSEKPKTVSSTSQPATQAMQPPVTPPVTAPTPAPQSAAKPVRKKAVRHPAATVTYTDKTSGMSFQYPRKYTLKTGDAASELVSSDGDSMDIDKGSMNFAQPGGVPLVAISVPEGAYPKSDLASASFDVSVNKSLTAEQCAAFSTPQGKPPISKLIVGDMELQSTETIASAGSQQQASKYYHVFENGACYEFALQVVTTADETDEGGKHVDRDEIFNRLEKILATVKISPTSAPQVTAGDTTSHSTPATPAQ